MTWLRRHRGARNKQYPAMAALFVTFFLVGAWHGPTSEFLFFGLLQGGGTAGNRLYQVTMVRLLTQARYQRLCENRIYRAVSRGLTFTWFAFTLLWFWSNWSQINTFEDMLGIGGTMLALFGIVAASSVVLALPEALDAPWVHDIIKSRYMRTAFASVMVLAMAIAGLVLNLASPEIVYKQF